jgi:hypothetical protein
MLCNGSRDLHCIDIGDPPETKTSLMGRKNKANKACVQTLVIARERKAILEKNKHMLLKDRRNWHHRDQDRTLDPTFVADSLEPELPPDNIQSEDADENIETEDSPEQVLECNALLSIRPTWTGLVTAQHVTRFVDTMCDDNRSPAGEKA